MTEDNMQALEFSRHTKNFDSTKGYWSGKIKVVGPEVSQIFPMLQWKDKIQTYMMCLGSALSFRPRYNTIQCDFV